MPTGKKPDPDPAHPASTTDADEFARAMDDVRPLRPDARGRVRRALAPPAPSAPTPERERDEDGADPREDSYAAPGLDRREIRKLKRGEYPPGARLDLHGEIATAALSRVEQFLIDSRHARRRCICIVHGRGLHSRTGASVLKSRVREHLRASPHVLAWTDAPPGDGGHGAVYVLLRR
ncbi:MAG TPA: Smr/MutS family protein [Vicinamibacterales bacterium]